MIQKKKHRTNIPLANPVKKLRWVLGFPSYKEGHDLCVFTPGHENIGNISTVPLSKSLCFLFVYFSCISYFFTLFGVADDPKIAENSRTSQKIALWGVFFWVWWLGGGVAPDGRGKETWPARKPGNPLPLHKRIIRYTVHSTQYTVHSTQYTVHSTQYTVHSTQYTVHSTQYTVHSTQYTVHSTQYTVHSTQYTVHSTQYTVHSTQYTVHSTQYTVHSTQYTVHSTQYTVHSTQYTVHSTQYTVHSTQYTVHSTQYTVHSTQYTVHSTQYTVQHLVYIGTKYIFFC